MKSLLTLVLLIGVGSTMLVGADHFDVIGTKFIGAYVGTRTHCFFWSLDPSNPYRVEVACYTDNILKTIYVAKKDDTLIGTYVNDEGQISWIFRPTITNPPDAASPLLSYAIGLLRKDSNNLFVESVRIDAF